GPGDRRRPRDPAIVLARSRGALGRRGCPRVEDPSPLRLDDREADRPRARPAVRPRRRQGGAPRPPDRRREDDDPPPPSDPRPSRLRPRRVRRALPRADVPSGDPRREGSLVAKVFLDPIGSPRESAVDDPTWEAQRRHLRALNADLLAKRDE